MKDTDVQDAEKIYRIQSSLMKPALDIVQNMLDSGSVQGVLKLLNTMDGTVEDSRDLLIQFSSTLQESKEKPSEYLNRLYLLLDELLQRDIVKVADGPCELLKQFIYGCSDESLIMKLRLEEKENSPPDFGTLLLSIRREEAKRTRRNIAAKLARTHQVSTQENEL